jgi:hypothetical protein
MLTVNDKAPCAIDLTKLSGNSKYAINHLGNEDATTLTGTSGDELFVAGAGNDTPPSTRARLPVPVCANAAMLLADIIIMIRFNI